MKTESRDHKEHQQQNNKIIAALIVALLFNSILAAINEHALRINSQYTIICEVFLLIFAATIIGKTFGKGRDLRIVQENYYFIYIVMAFVATSLVVFAYNQKFEPKPVRDFLILITFWKIGMLMNRETYFAIMRYSAYLVLAGAIVEIVVPNVYTSIFNPSAYYFYTRGIEGDSPTGDEAGLYKTTDGYGSRFSINFLSDHRLSSIFLEPVSFGNFIVVAFVFCIAYWRFLSVRDRVLFVALFVIGTIGSDSRTATFLSVFIILYLPISRRFSASLAVFYVPIALTVSCVLSAIFDTSKFSDTLEGRLSWSGHLLSNSGLADVLFGNLYLSGLNVPDAGLFYVIATHSIFGLLILVIMLAVYPRRMSAPDRTLAHGLVLFFAVKMMISSSLFSIKVSPFLWIGIGFLVAGGLSRYWPPERLRSGGKPLSTQARRQRSSEAVIIE